VITEDRTGRQTLGLFDTVAHAAAGPAVEVGRIMGSFWTDGKTAMVITDGFARVRTVDLVTGEIVEPSIDPSTGTIGQVVVDSGRLYTQAEDWENNLDGFRVERRDPSTGEVIARSDAGFVRMTAGGGIVVAATIDGRVVELDPETLEPRGDPFPSVPGQFGAGYLAIDQHGRRLVIRADDDTLRFYDVGTRTQLGDPIDIDSDIQFASVAIRGDGKVAASVTGQGIVTYDLDPAHWEDAACRLAGRNLTKAEWNQYLGHLAPYRETCPDLTVD
jgi:hypothetical protein